MKIKSHGKTLVGGYRLVTLTVLEFSEEEVAEILLKYAISLRPDIGESSGTSTVRIQDGQCTLRRTV